MEKQTGRYGKIFAAVIRSLVLINYQFAAVFEERKIFFITFLNLNVTLYPKIERALPLKFFKKVSSIITLIYFGEQDAIEIIKSLIMGKVSNYICICEYAKNVLS